MKTIEFGVEYEPDNILNDFGEDTHKYKFAVELEVRYYDDGIEDEIADNTIQKAIKLIKQAKSSTLMKEYESNKDDYESFEDFLYEEYSHQLLWLQYEHTCEEFGGTEEYSNNRLLEELIKDESGITGKFEDNLQYNRGVSVSDFFDIAKPMTFKELYMLYNKEAYISGIMSYKILERVD